jgi:hypoxanthine phosphoribosyltransferase
MSGDGASLNEVQAVSQAADCLFSAAEVEAALARMAADLNQRLASANPVVLATMIGGVVLAGQLLPRLRFTLTLDYVHLTRYRGATSGGDIHWIRRPPELIKDLPRGWRIGGIDCGTGGKGCRARGASSQRRYRRAQGR